MATYPYKIGNLGWKFYRGMFQDMKFDYLTIEHDQRRKDAKNRWIEANKPAFEKRVKEITDTSLPNEDGLKKQLIDHSERIKLVTTYPGLVLGTGYAHQVSVEGECKLGFHFDHTTGLPIIPGSSVKGVLRSVFPGYVKIQQSKLEEDERKLKEEIAYLKLGCLTALEILPDFSTENAWTALEMLLFEGKTWVDGEWKVMQKSFERIIFHDGVITGTGHSQRKFLGIDFLTPHINRDNQALSPFTNPTPLQFLKVLPQVEFTFQFRIPQVLTVEWQEDSGPQTASLSREQLCNFFRRILLEQGVGAKTNVGYGQFAQPIPQPTLQIFPPTQDEADTENDLSTQEKMELEKYEGNMIEGATIMVKILDPQKRKVEILLPTGKMEVEMGRLNNWPAPGVLVKATISQVNRKGIIQMVTYKGPI